MAADGLEMHEGNIMRGYKIGQRLLLGWVVLIWCTPLWATEHNTHSNIYLPHAASRKHSTAKTYKPNTKSGKQQAPLKEKTRSKKAHAEKQARRKVKHIGRKTQKASSHQAHPHSRHHVVPATKGSANNVKDQTQEDEQEKAPAAAVTAPALIDPHKGSVTGMPLPRFASLRADEVNWRAGPGSRYPIQWVYHRRGMPVQILREFDVWRLIADVSGNKGWVHQATLVGRRSFIIAGENGLVNDQQEGKSGKATTITGKADTRIEGYIADISSVRHMPGSVIMRAQANENSTVVALLKPGSIGWIEHCEGGASWCQVKVQQYRGWLPRKVFWGLMPDEVIQ